MKKLAVSLVALLLITGCSVTPGASQTPTSTEEATAAATTRPAPVPSPSPSTSRTTPAPGYGLEGLSSAETVYIGKLVQEFPRLREKSNDALLGVGEVPCALYDNGATSSQVNEFLFQGSGVAYLLEELASIHGLGVAALCPEHVSKVGA